MSVDRNRSRFNIEKEVESTDYEAPQELEKTRTVQELADLLAYLKGEP